VSAGTASVAGLRASFGRSRTRLLRHPKVVLPASLLGVLVVLAVGAPVFAPYGPNEQDLMQVLQGPSADHWFGTDSVGRDQLSRLLFGMRTSLLASSEAVALAVAVGVPTGLLAGYRGGRLDAAASRVNEAIMSVPGLVLALTVVAVLGPGLFNAMMAVGVVLTPMLFRISRAAALEVKENTFVEAAVSIGCPHRRILWRHVAPNSIAPLIVQISLLFGYAIVAESSLSYLGLGVRAPDPSLGAMLAAAYTRLDLRYLILSPGIALCLLVVGFILLGDGLRESLSVHHRGGRR
jgi:peptide/nickel transport system permease protein